MIKDEPIETFIAGSEEEGERLDKLLHLRFHQIQSRTYFQHLIQEGHVLLNGHSAKKRIKVRMGDEIFIRFALSEQIQLEPEPIPLEILYEDNDMIVVNKAEGMVVHPAPGNWSGTFVNALLFHCQHLADGTLRPGIVHRLDKGTTGVLVAAKNVWTQQKLISAFAERRVEKEYLAICVGNPGVGEVCAPIGRHPVHRKKMAVLEQGGRFAKSRFVTEAFDGKYSIVRIRLLTGRTHQIRVHLASVGAPILGDELYGSSQRNRREGLEHPLLHAHRLCLRHPREKKNMEFVAPLPKEMQRRVESLISRSGYSTFSEELERRI